MRALPGQARCERRDLAVASRRTNVHAGLVARSRELAHIDQLLWQARRGKSGALGLRGECGVGKSALIEAAVARATEFRTVQVRGRALADGANGAATGNGVRGANGAGGVSGLSGGSGAPLATGAPDGAAGDGGAATDATTADGAATDDGAAADGGTTDQAATNAAIGDAATVGGGAANGANTSHGAPHVADDLPLLPQWPDPLHELAAYVEHTAPEPPRFESTDDALRGAPSPPSDELVEAAAASLRRMVASANGPLLVTVDDCHSLPPGLVAALAGAVLTQLADQPISLVLAWRDTPHLEPFELGWPDVPVHRLGGLTAPQARELLASRFDQLPAEPVLAELVGRTGGNPLVLVEVCSRLSPAQLAGWHPLPDPLPVTGTSAEAFDVIRYLPPPTRRSLAVVAAGGASSEAMVAAMARLGVGIDDLVPAIDAGIVYERGPRIDFRHPLVRSVAFHRSPIEVRQAIRGALSDVLAETHAIEASAYHASVDVAAPDELAARRLSQAAQVALDRGDPAAAAQHEELAARCAGAPEAVVQHLADAAGHWVAAGERDRAQYCLESATELEVVGPVVAELAYHRARLHDGPEDSGSAAERMVAAAESCAGQRPHRALAMLVDAAAWRVLADEPVEAARVAEQAVRLAGAVSSHSEVLARTVRAAAVLAGGGEIDEAAERSHVSLLIGQSERWPSSPEVALVVGRSLAAQGLSRQSERWAQWIARCAERSGDVTLAAVPPLLDCSLRLAAGDLDEAATALDAGAAATEAGGSAAMVAWSWQLATELHAMAGRYEEGFTAGARLFAATDRMGAPARLRALPSLALLELQRGRRVAAVAWARTAEQDLESATAETLTEVAPMVASVLFLARSPSDPDRWAPLRNADGSLPVVPGWCRDWVIGVCDADPAEAAQRLETASAALAHRPLSQAVVDLCLAVRLESLDRSVEAAARLATVDRRAHEAGAAGLAALAARERAELRVPDAGGFAAETPAAAGHPVGAPSGSPGGSGQRPPSATLYLTAEWEISVLGGFSVRRRGKPVALPASLATQAIKIVALHPRLTVDELIELLWEDAEPGIGARRLRNVLWRIRSLCGELLVREGTFIRFAPGAVTDLERFRSLADQALVGPGAGDATAVDTARAALDCYRGELLPGDRYADWSAAARESVARTHLRLLDLLVEDALAGERRTEALALLDRLAEVDPYDERHHLRTAQIHLDAGNRGRALDALERAERMLADLRVAPSPAVQRLREQLDQA